MSRARMRLANKLPLLVFLGMYFFSCYVGVLLLLISNDFWSWTNYFSGPRLMPLDRRGLLTLLGLLHGGPILLWLGYETSSALCRRYLKLQPLRSLEPAQRGLGWALVPYALSVGAAVWSLGRAGAFAQAGAWFNYNSYVHARWDLFSKISFFEYVNIYTWLPCCSSFLLLSRRKRRWLFLPVLAILAFIQLSLFLKKSLLTSIVFIACALWAYWYLGRAPRKVIKPRLWLGSSAALCLVLYSVHAALTAQLVFSSKTRVFTLTEEERLIASAGGQAKQSPPALTQAAAAAVVNFDGHLTPSTNHQTIALYTFFAPLTRTSVPAIAYVELFPNRLPYYHVDFGLDILGIGRMPEDNRVVSDALWPEQKGGSVAVPFHFALYSQGGMWVAFVGSFLVGSFFAACWYPISTCRRPSMSGSLFASVVLTYAWLNSIDSLRNNTVVSYGMIWAAAAVVLLYWWERRAWKREAQSASGDRGEH
jgi:hypothetical protein